MYALVAVQPDADWLPWVKAAVADELHAVALPGDAIVWLSIEDAVRKRASIAVLAVYLGGGAPDRDLNGLLEADIRVAPLLRKDQDDPSALPETVLPINAIFWSGSGSEAVRTLLRTLGLLEQLPGVLVPGALRQGFRGAHRIAHGT